MAQTNQYATGKRKYAVARAWIEPGQGTIQVNGRPLANYFPRMTHQLQVQTPFDITKTMGQFNVQASLTGGGISGHGSRGVLQRLYGPRRHLFSSNHRRRQYLAAGPGREPGGGRQNPDTGRRRAPGLIAGA